MSGPNPYYLVSSLWSHLGLPSSALSALKFENEDTAVLPSAHHIDALSSSSIAIVSLAAAQYSSLITNTPIPQVKVSQPQATLAFKSERLYTLDGVQQELSSYFGRLHQCKDGWVRVHDAFKLHRNKVCEVLGLKEDAGKSEVSEVLKQWSAYEFEDAVSEAGAVAVALRNRQQWAVGPGRNTSELPIDITSLSNRDIPRSQGATTAGLNSERCLSGLKVVELSRVIAAPVAGRALAAHGADVIWVTGPPGKTEDLPILDRDFSRGKRSVCLDLSLEDGKAKLEDLVREADVFIQGYRPGSLDKKGFGAEAIYDLNPRCIYAELNAWGKVGPWSERRGFDSIVQTASGMNHDEARLFDGSGSLPAKPLPCQFLDHGSGYFLAAGIIAALCRQLETGEAYRVHVSLVGTANFLQGLGCSRFNVARNKERSIDNQRDVFLRFGAEGNDYFAEQDTAWGRVKYLKYPAIIEGREIGWQRPAEPIGCSQPSWL